ncbi:MAG TPA: HAMP domain-containing sensor histidine kinase [Ktedonosporobacter sp.]|nr:HAMP domain-containing sensor histidine kinase [Ktedonosporobacter sp.]
MKHSVHPGDWLWKIHLFPLSVLSFSRGKRLLIVLFSYGVAIPGLWFFFPHVHNAASMLLPIICLCWLFRYRGLLISLCSSALALWLIAHYLLGGSASGQDVVVRAVLGFGISILLGLTICWLRIAVDLIYAARQQTIAAEQERLQAVEAERSAKLAYEQQRQVNELKDQFLLHVNHELRTPLSVLGSFLELFRDHFDLMDPADRNQLIGRALANFDELVILVDEVLNTVAVTGALPPVLCEDVPVLQIVQEVLAHLDPQHLKAYTIRLHVAEQLLAWANPQSLYHVLQNLLSNIFKYVPEQTAICIEATQPAPSSPVFLSVQDAGPGIPPEELPLLFERFVRLKRDLAGPIRGTGLGLYICKCLVEAMGGRIWAESSGRAGEGSRFCLTLPPIPASSPS